MQSGIHLSEHSELLFPGVFFAGSQQWNGEMLPQLDCTRNWEKQTEDMEDW